MGDPIRAEAADLLACVASQPEEIDSYNWYATFDLPGRWSRGARRLARETMAIVEWSGDWREAYAEAEASLREAADVR